MIKFKHILPLALMGAALAAGPAKADQLDDIKKAGEMTCGTLGTSQPFSFQDISTDRKSVV